MRKDEVTARRHCFPEGREDMGGGGVVTDKVQDEHQKYGDAPVEVDHAPDVGVAQGLLRACSGRRASAPTTMAFGFPWRIPALWATAIGSMST